MYPFYFILFWNIPQGNFYTRWMGSKLLCLKYLKMLLFSYLTWLMGSLVSSLMIKVPWKLFKSHHFLSSNIQCDWGDVWGVGVNVILSFLCKSPVFFFIEPLKELLLILKAFLTLLTLTFLSASFRQCGGVEHSQERSHLQQSCCGPQCRKRHNSELLEVPGRDVCYCWQVCVCSQGFQNSQVTIFACAETTVIPIWGHVFLVLEKYIPYIIIFMIL